MHNTKDNTSRWGELVEQLHSRLDVLVDLFMARVQEIPEYAGNRVGLAELRDTARETFRRLVDGLRDKELQQSGRNGDRDSLMRFSSELGTKRARAGISPDALISAVRLDFGILWDDLLLIADPEDAMLLTSRVDRVWRVVDEFATHTHSSYSAERVRMAQEASNIRREFIARLFSKSELSADTISQAAAALVTDPDARFSIVAASGEAASQLRAIAAQGPQSSQRLFVHEFGGSAYVFWALGRTAGGAQPGGSGYLPAGIAGIPCGYVEGFSGLRALPSAARTAERLALLLHPSDRGPLTAADAWARLAKQQLQDAGLDLWADLDSSLSPCRGGERERLEETVRHFLSTGNITTTAQSLFCHRNTILNRLNRFQDLTGIDLTVPSQAARLVVAWA
ncbi:PucR family transcriptional regulator [Pseudarthrobacter psychrotolerans]|uniref:PucR family transcriptional regulator n=1 Tax=Pseudarthrobacter psychrotolerans TaxID=2697569 RepID=A0A6P1NIV4_9MICC|nr:PucR family transcriptional regulator [Pseudarthrobacter psychrotolerans]QHK19033.1 PucR family transcriptional regulator [Pseudarthrobacter psychrotolerans]